MRIKIPNISFSKNTQLRSELLNEFDDCHFNEAFKRYKGADLVDFLKDADGAIVGLEMITDELLSKCPKLKIISKYGVGLDSIDQDACAKHKVKVGWTGGVNKRSVSEMTLGFILMLLRNLYVSSNELKTNNWNKVGGVELSGKSVGVIGVGRIGKDLIRLLKPFGCKILVNDIIDQSAYYNSNELIEATKEEIYEQSDVITVHTPLNDSTRYLFNLESFKLMSKKPIVINVARGGIINQHDLKIALEHNFISGAAIDVYEEEPCVDQDLLCIPNLINTPHTGGNSKEAVLAMGRSAINHLKEYFTFE